MKEIVMRPIRSFLEDRSWSCAVIAHRGAWHHGPENSIPAIEVAANSGYAFVELDMSESFDGTFYCLHDETLDRMTETSGLTGLRSWKELSQMRLRQGGGGTSPLTEEKIISLDTALEATRDRVYVDMDVKHQRQVERVGEIVRKKSMTDQVNLKMDVYCRSDAEDLKRLEAKTGCLVKPILRVDSRNIANTLLLLDENVFPMIEVLCSSSEVLVQIVSRAKRVGTDVFVNTLDAVPSSPIKDTDAVQSPSNTWGSLISMGVRLIQTDEPAALGAYIESLT